MKPRIRKSGCFWIVLTPNATYGWAYDRVHETWGEALRYALRGARW